MKLGQEYYSMKDGKKYEVSKITSSYIYLVHFNGTCSTVKYLTIGGNKDKNKEFVKPYRKAWTTFLKNEIKKNQGQVNRDKATLKACKDIP